MFILHALGIVAEIFRDCFSTEVWNKTNKTIECPVVCWPCSRICPRKGIIRWIIWIFLAPRMAVLGQFLHVYNILGHLRKEKQKSNSHWFSCMKFVDAYDTNTAWRTLSTPLHGTPPILNLRCFLRSFTGNYVEFYVRNFDIKNLWNVSSIKQQLFHFPIARSSVVWEIAFDS